MLKRASKVQDGAVQRVAAVWRQNEQEASARLPPRVANRTLK